MGRVLAGGMAGPWFYSPGATCREWSCRGTPRRCTQLRMNGLSWLPPARQLAAWRARQASSRFPTCLRAPTVRWKGWRPASDYALAHETGPVGLIFTHPGRPPVNGTMILIGFLTNLVAGMLTAGILWQARASLESYWVRVGFVTTIGFLIAVVTHVPYWNWLYAAPDYSIVMFVDTWAAFLITGLVMGRLWKYPGLSKAYRIQS